MDSSNASESSIIFLECTQSLADNLSISVIVTEAQFIGNWSFDILSTRTSLYTSSLDIARCFV